MTLQNFRHGSLAGGPILLQMGWPLHPAKNYVTWPHDPANRHSTAEVAPARIAGATHGLILSERSRRPEGDGEMPIAEEVRSAQCGSGLRE